jgi:riboflavin kinase/FMN adenylyltransferase
VRSLGHESGTLVAIGNFDGVHRGHRAVLNAAIHRANRQQLGPVVLTFHPHPAVVLGRGQQPTLTPIERKVELLCRLDPALRVVVEPFTEDLANMTPLEFVKELLVERLAARVVMVGENFRFGHRRSGDLTTLRSLGRTFGFDALAEALETYGGRPISSSRIREAIAAGNVAGAATLLGRPHSLTGMVIVGDQRGRSIGVPTANLGDVRGAVPSHGVYACVVDRLEADTAHALGIGVANIGIRPTVAAGFSVEVHVIDYSDDLYGAELRVHLVERLRGEQRFSGLDELVKQIHADIEVARDVLLASAPESTARGGWF